MADKEYQRLQRLPWWPSCETARKLLARKPEALVESAVARMLPKNRLGRRLFGNLRGGRRSAQARSPEAPYHRPQHHQ